MISPDYQIKQYKGDLKMKKIIKLINNERLDAKIESSKACVSTSHDVCNSSAYDKAECSTYSYDQCGKDYAACYNYGYDLCTVTDTDACSGSTRDID